jgi:predicted metalloprotease
MTEIRAIESHDQVAIITREGTLTTGILYLPGDSRLFRSWINTINNGGDVQYQDRNGRSLAVDDSIRILAVRLPRTERTTEILTRTLEEAIRVAMRQAWRLRRQE